MVDIPNLIGKTSKLSLLKMWNREREIDMLWGVPKLDWWAISKSKLKDKIFVILSEFTLQRTFRKKETFSILLWLILVNLKSDIIPYKIQPFYPRFDNLKQSWEQEKSISQQNMALR